MRRMSNSRDKATKPHKSHHVNCNTISEKQIHQPKSKKSKQLYATDRETRSLQIKQLQELVLPYHMPMIRNKKTGSQMKKSQKSHKQFSISSNIFNQTFDVQSPPSQQKRKKSKFSSTVCSKNELKGDMYASVLLKTGRILENYKMRCEQLQQENISYKRKFNEAARKIKDYGSRF